MIEAPQQLAALAGSAVRRRCVQPIRFEQRDALVLPAPKAAKADLDADVSARHGKPAVTVGREARAAPSDAPARGADCGVEAVIETISPFVPLGFFVPPADGEGWRLPASLAQPWRACATCAGTGKLRPRNGGDGDGGRCVACDGSGLARGAPAGARADARASDDELDVAIVGGGIGGLAAALAMQQRGRAEHRAHHGPRTLAHLVRVRVRVRVRLRVRF